MASERISVEFITTGNVWMRNPMQGQPIANRSIAMRFLRSLTGGDWIGPMPLGAFLIRHPAGPILFDTGVSTHCTEPGYFPCLNPVPGMLNKLEVTRGDGIVDQLRRRGVEPTDLQFVVLSHLHHDHAGGLEELAVAAPDVPVYVGPDHWDAFGKHPVWAAMQGCTPDRWPPGFEPRMLDFEERRAVGPWHRSCVLTANGSVVAVDTPGHVPGHVSLIVVGDNDDDDGTTTRYLLTGDATYAIDVLEREEPDGANVDPVSAFESLRKIKEYARTHDVVVLPSHDPDTPRLLRDRVVYRPKDLAREAVTS